MNDNQFDIEEPIDHSLSEWILSLVDKFFSNHSKPNSLIRVRRQASDIPESLTECIYGEDKANPLTKYMQKSKGKSCRNGEMMLNDKRDGVEVSCCKYTGNSNKVPQVYAGRCVFENGQPIMNLMHFPAKDLICKDPDLYEVTSFKVPHVITGKMMSLACCNKIETTTTTTTKATTTTTTKATTTTRNKNLFYFTRVKKLVELRRLPFEPLRAPKSL